MSDQHAVAHAHIVFERSYELKVLIHRAATLAMPTNSRESHRATFANAHVVMARSYGTKSLARCCDAIANAANNSTEPILVLQAAPYVTSAIPRECREPASVAYNVCWIINCSTSVFVCIQQPSEGLRLASLPNELQQAARHMVSQAC
eukprot:gnl/TRDRNA2_/TRDRNA2_218399_c0_seq1.p1 gnl/TRDRNA2_/TRDRNA2_218399_c0~~gnl/TRDRNA2_/TRDRNA2_218399_c0_seq1.p1  ORF type:complete len:161 (+),score=15.34 gnl/TRDRNA2_/TRDRNA2_218399_c0_seq1:41-484(+)